MLAPSRTLLVGTIISQADVHGLGMQSKATRVDGAYQLLVQWR